MKHILHSMLLALFVVLSSYAPAQNETVSPSEARMWTDRKGRSLEASFVSFSDGEIEIKRTSDGKVFKLPLENFSEADQTFVRSHLNSSADSTSVSDERKIQVGDPDLKFDPSKFDPNYPQMRIWMEAGVTNGIPHLEEQLKTVAKVFDEGTTDEELKAYFESPEVKYKPVVVLLKNGEYTFSERTVRIYSQATLIGESRDGVVIHVSGKSGISLYNGKSIGLRNLTLEGKWSDTPPDPEEAFSEGLPGMGDHRMINMARCENSFVDNVRILNSASHPIWVSGKNNTLRNLDIDGAHCKGGGCQGYFFIDGQRNLITGCKVTRLRHISFQNPSSKENVFYNNDVRQEVSFHTDDGGDNLIENNRITIPRYMKAYNAIMGPWSTQHKVGGKNFIYNNTCEEENNRKRPWSDSKLYIGPFFVSNKNDRERYDNFVPVKTPLPNGGTLYPVMLEP